MKGIRFGSALAALVASAMGGGAIREARACLPPPMGVHARWMMPAPGAKGVPLNAMVRVVYQATGVKVGDIVLRKVGGKAVDVRRFQDGAEVLAPKKPLAPGTTYEVLDRFPKVPCMGSGCTAKGYSVIGRFTTGKAADHTPPLLSGTATIRYGPNICRSTACCGPYVLSEARVGFAAGSDPGGGPVAYRVYRLPDTKRGAWSRWNNWFGFRTCSGRHTLGGPPGAVPATSGTYLVRAVDLAGNESKGAVKWTVTFRCGPPPDGGLRRDAARAHRDGAVDSKPLRADAKPDAKPVRPDAKPVKPDARGGGKAGGGSSGGGCALEGGGGRLPAPVLLLLVLGLAAGRPARRRAR